jgi:hypothetical protein
MPEIYLSKSSIRACILVGRGSCGSEECPVNDEAPASDLPGVCETIAEGQGTVQPQ